MRFPRYGSTRQVGDRLRVAMVGGYPMNPADTRGGVQAATAHLLRGLAKISDLEMHVLVFKRPGWAGPDQIEQNGVKIHFLPMYPRFERLRNYRRYQAILNHKLAQIQPDVVHAQEAAADAYVALKSGFPTIITVHGIHSEDRKYFTSFSQRLRFYFDSVKIERYVMRNTQHLIAISHYVTDYFAPLLTPDLDVYYVPNAIDERFFDLTGDSNEQVVLFAGRVIPLKRVMDLVQAFAQVVQQVPSAKLRVAGECNSEASYARSIHRWVHQAGLGGQIQLLGEMPEEAILNEFSKCNLVALPSSQENAPMVIAQAMAAGKPVVASRVGGIAEMVGKEGERGILVQVGDIDGLAGSMLRLLQDSSLRTRLGQAGQVFARENYHQDRVAQRTWEIYKKTLGWGAKNQ